MRVFFFSFWYLPDNRTAVNRIKYFKKKFLESDIDLKLIYCDDSSFQDTLESNNYKISHTHFFYKFSRFLLKRHWLFLYKIIHFFYLISRKRDVYDFYRNYKAIESERAFNFSKQDYIVTSAPPYSALNIGYYIKKKFGVKWIIDYRDPWTLGYPTLGFSTFADKLRRIFQRNDELKFLEFADYIITVSESLKKTFPEKYWSKIHVVPNGANTDEMDFTKINSRPNTFSLVYAGTIHFQQLQRTYFFDVLKTFIAKNNIQPENFKLHFIGSKDSTELEEIVEQLHLEDYFNITSRLALEDLYSYMYEASMFLHLKYDDRDKIITSKQFEYLALQKPILLPESDEGDLEESILGNNAGFVCSSPNELINVLETQYSNYLDGVDVRINRDNTFIEKISRNYASSKLVELILLDNSKHHFPIHESNDLVSI